MEQLEVVAKEAGLSLLQLALGFVVAHRAVTSAIIGPRTYEQLEEQLGAADVTLTSDLLDRIDELAPPGRNINPDDVGWTPPNQFETQSFRRRAGL